MRPKIEIYTDGACLGNPGPGGWAAVLISGVHYKEIHGGEPETTNQRMELLAAIKALEALKRPSEVTLYSDSAYLINAFREDWVGRWQRLGWQTAKKTPVENQDLWRRLIDLTKIHRVTWAKLKGHAGHKENERCDQLAKEAAKVMQQQREQEQPRPLG